MPDPFTELCAWVRPEVERRLSAVWRRELARAGRFGRGVMAMAAGARDLTLRGGKRFRAALLVAAYRGVAPRADVEVAFAGAVAIELLQTYLLIQDDWIDGDATRRGGPSVHAALEALLGDRHLAASAAILASDLTWSLAVDALASASAPAPRVLAAVRELCRVHGDVVVGQQLDVLGEAGGRRPATPRAVEAMHALKTGSYTVRGPLVVGARLGGAPESSVRALERWSEPLGVAFQLRDDLLGTFASPAETGKPEAGDLRAGKTTAVTLEGRRRLDAAGRRALARVLGNPSAPIRNVRAVVGALEACGARAAVEKRLTGLVERAARAAAALPLSRQARAELEGAARALLPSRLAGRSRVEAP